MPTRQILANEANLASVAESAQLAIYRLPFPACYVTFDFEFFWRFRCQGTFRLRAVV